MRLSELNAQFIGAGGTGVFKADGSPAEKREGVGVMFDCPCGCKASRYVPFRIALDGKPGVQGDRGWDRTGDTIETLTLSPSILISKEHGGCGWHGYIREGGIVHC